ncbi:MAG: triple tyrosine motif-containing protein [Flammeovirgaceae bacterium]
MLIILFVNQSHQLFAQNGRFFLRHYNPDLLNVDNQNYAIAQDEYGLLCFANRKGVLKFNGVEWGLIPTPGSALALVLNHQDGHLYVGCRNNFGYIIRDNKGQDTYVSLSDSLDFEGDVSHIEIVGNWVYFLTDEQLFEYSSVEKRVTNRYKAKQNDGFFSLFQHRNQAHIITENHTLYQAYSNKLKALNYNLSEENYPVFSVNLSKKKSVVGMAEGGLYVLENEAFSLLALDDADYLKDHNLLNGLRLDDSLLVLSTLSGGVLIVNWETGNTVEQIDYEAGLPDNEVYAIFKDEKNNIWIAHEYGISVLDFNSPIFDYSSYYGLKGGILTVAETEEMLYVGTSIGLFYFDRIDDIRQIRQLIQEQIEEERPVIVGNKIRSRPSKKATKQLGKKNTSKDAEASKKKSPWLKRLFSKRDGKKRKKKKDRRKKKGNKKKGDEEAKDSVATDIDPEPVDEILPEAKENEVPLKKVTVRPKYTVEKITITKESYYAFQQLEEIEGKCQQLIAYPDGMLAVTNAGMFAVKGKKVEIITRSPIRLAHYSEKFDRIYASTYNDELLVFKYEDRKWQKVPVFTGFDDYVSAFLEDDAGNLWVSGNSYIFKLILDENGQFASMQEHEIKNPYNDDIRAVKWQGKIYFLLSSGAYYYDGDKLQLDRELIKEGEASKILSNTHEISWLHNGTEWLMLSGKNTAHISTSMKLNYLKWLGELSGIFLGAKHALWAVTKENNLFRIDLKEGQNDDKGYGVYLKHVRNHQNQYLSLQDFKVDRKDNHVLYFSFSIPSYFEEGHAKYQYRLIGKDDNWTDWTPQNIVSYVGLPSGKYQLVVRGKDAFGNITELEPVTFQVVPPYWEQPWFYGAEILLFSTLLVLSYRLNRRSRKVQYKVLSQVLTIFTLILIVEFVQVTLEAQVNIEKTPVSNFAIQAGIALLVFPLERLLSYVIRQEHVRKRKNQIAEMVEASKEGKDEAKK